MNQEPCSYALTQISYLVSNLNKKNFATNSRQLAQFVKDFGLEADRHLLRCLFSAVDFVACSAAGRSGGDAATPGHSRSNSTSSSASNSNNNYYSSSGGPLSLQARLLSTELVGLLTKPQLVGNVCFAVDNPLPQQRTLTPSINLVTQIVRTLNCSPIQQAALALALLHSSHPDIVRSAEENARSCIAELIQSYIDLDSTEPTQEGSLNDVSPELLQHILSLISHDRHRDFGLSDSTYGKFVQQLCRDFPRERVPLILAPLLYPENSELSAESVKANSQSLLRSSIMDTAWGSLVMEIGYGFTASVEDCKNHLLKVGGREIAAQDVAKIISSMCLTHASLSESSINLPTPSSFWPQGSDPGGKGKDGQNGGSSSENSTWKPEIFVQALKEAVPNLNWKDVCLAFDHADFLIKDRPGLALLLSIVKMGMQASGLGQNFPVECVYQRWTNVEGQLSLITMILKSPDLYSFADHIYTRDRKSVV